MGLFPTWLFHSKWGTFFMPHCQNTREFIIPLNNTTWKEIHICFVFIISTEAAQCIASSAAKNMNNGFMIKKSYHPNIYPTSFVKRLLIRFAINPQPHRLSLKLFIFRSSYGSYTIWLNIERTWTSFFEHRTNLNIIFRI